MPIVVSVNGLIAKILNHHLNRLTLDGWIKGVMQKAVSTFGHGAYFFNVFFICYNLIFKNMCNNQVLGINKDTTNVLIPVYCGKLGTH